MGSTVGECGNLTVAADNAFKSIVWSEINSLKASISDSEVHELRSMREREGSDPSHISAHCKTCLLFVRVKSLELLPVGTSRLEYILSCRVLRYWCVGIGMNPSFKVKILEVDKSNAFQAGATRDCYVAPWQHRKSQPCVQSNGEAYKADAKVGMENLNLISWNCRGLSSGVPYIRKLVGDKKCVVALSEHWLWPYKLGKLNKLSEEYTGTGKVDIRLLDKAEGGRSCGGVGLLWHKSIEATPVHGISSDCICAIRFKADDEDGSLVSIISVYLPCLDQGM